MRGRRRSNKEFQPAAGKQLRVIPRPVIDDILKEPFQKMDMAARDQLMKAEAKRLMPIWQQEWLEIKEKYPTYASSVNVTSYTNTYYGIQVPKGFPTSGGPSIDIPAQVRIPKIPADPLPYLMSELAYVFPALTRYIEFYYSRLNIRIPESHRPSVDYNISDEFKDIVKQATAHLTVVRANEKKKE